jgi:hypothetical protein
VARCGGVGNVLEQRVVGFPALDDDVHGTWVDPDGRAVIVAGVGVDAVEV